jgi:hypothetical protein
MTRERGEKAGNSLKQRMKDKRQKAKYNKMKRGKAMDKQEEEIFIATTENE